VDALGKIGLRNAPPTRHNIFKDRDVLDACREWWREIEAGRKTFSFAGQKVEYRFKPDGTWDTIAIANPPDDGPEAAADSEEDRPLRRPAPAQADSREASRGISWWWYGIGGAALLAACARLWRRNG
jgi:hypothetical protein